jgi:pre-mRNA-splicing factor RBM22/SLT11
MPTSRNDPLANQNIKDRFYGQDDPVAQKMLGRVAAKDEEDLAPLIPPSDPSIMTLMVGGMEGGAITEMELRDAFYAFGELVSVRLIHAKHIAFVEYTTREAAEAAAKALHNNLTLQGLRLRLTWAMRPAGGALSNASTSSGSFAMGGGGGGFPAAATAGGGGGRGGGSFAPSAYSMPPPPGSSLPLPPPQYMPAPPPSNWAPGTIPPPPPGAPPPPMHYPHPQQYMQQQGGGPPSLPPPQQVCSY